MESPNPKPSGTDTGAPTVPSRPNDEGVGRRRRVPSSGEPGTPTTTDDSITSNAASVTPLPPPAPAASLKADDLDGPPNPSASRPGDEGVGRRKRELPPPEAVSRHEDMAKQAAADAQAAMERLEAEALTASTSFQGRRLGALAMIAVLLGGVVLFFAFTQLIAVVEALSNAPTALRWTGWGGLGLLLAAMTWCAIRLVLLWRGLRPSVPLHWVTVRDGSGQTREAARGLLRKYLDGYEPLLGESKAATAYGKLAGEPTRSTLREAVRFLRSDNAERSGAWLDEFDRRFLGTIDQRVDAVIKARAKMVAYQTILTPGRGLDTLLALYHAGCMLEEIARLYNQRLNRRQIPGALMRIVLQAGAAVGMESATESLAEIAADLALPQLEGAGAATIAKVAGAKTGEALGNYWFARRLGRRIKEALRPLKAR